LPKARPRARLPTPHAARRSPPPPPPSPLATSQQVHGRPLAACRRRQCPPHPRTPSLPHTFTTLPPPPHRAYPARQRHQTRASPTSQRGTRPTSVPAPPDGAVSLRQSHTAFVALLYSGTTDVFPRASSPRSTTPAPTPFPPSTPPALSPSEQMQIDHATIPPHTHLSYVPPVCNTSHLSLLCEDRHTIIRG
jgi:hypothetical protein